MTIPTATYRIQFRNGTDLYEGARLAPYLRALGISHLYASPITAALPGSTHGYDVADFNMIDPALGGQDGFMALSDALKAEGLGLIVDFVPNHMGASVDNPWWRDVLEWGQRSEHGEHFDIDWSAAKLVIPVLGQPYGDALAEGELGLSFDAGLGQIVFTYFALRLPLTPPSYAGILARSDDERFAELARRFAMAVPETAAETRSDLAALAADPVVRASVEAAVAAVAADQAALHELHEAQVWRLSYWRAAREGLTYRRFFEISDLVGIRVERPKVFEDAHRLLLESVAQDRIQGIRLDHIDGLADPKSYLQRLQGAVGREAPFYLLVEKILGPDETLRPGWPVAGTTGYEFITALSGLFVDPAGESALDAAYEAFLGAPVDYRDMVLATKRRILSRNLAGELDFLKGLATAIAERDPVTRDHGTDSLRRAILEFAAALPMYRTYVNVEGADETDRAIIATAVETVKATREVEDEGAVDFLARLLRLDFPDPERQAKALEFAARYQQTTGPVMAKALEDTVFYRYNRLVALNEVGGEPDRFGAPVEAFHDAMKVRLATQPAGLSGTATHDTKRGEDGRARLYAISEAPESWADAVQDWSSMLAGSRREIEGGVAPEPELEWLFYQSLAGAWPDGLPPDDREGIAGLSERMQAYMLKVVREAKARTTWTSPVAAYEDAVKGFTAGAFQNSGFLADFEARTAPLRLAGALNSLSQLAVKLAAPGVPDIYQGTEFWDLSLVDPDNRRPVDYAPREAMMEGLFDQSPEDLVGAWHSAALKLRLLAAGLRLRRDQSDVFAAGDYVPLSVTGSRAVNAVAFARVGETRAAVVIVPIRSAEMLAGTDRPLVPPTSWSDTAILLPDELAGFSFRDVVTGAEHSPEGVLRLAEALGRFPVALLAGTPD